MKNQEAQLLDGFYDKVANLVKVGTTLLKELHQFVADRMIPPFYDIPGINKWLEVITLSWLWRSYDSFH